MLTSTCADPCVYFDCPASRTHGFSIAPMPKPVVDPDTSIRLPSRDPVMTIDGPADARGTTTFDGSDDADQPAPVSAFTVKVYAVPFVNPPIEHARTGAATRQVRLPGDDVT